MFKPKSILVPTDFSKHSELAFRKAVEIAQIAGAVITLAHVQPVEFEHMSALYIGEDHLKEIREKISQEIQTNLENTVKLVDDLKGIEVKLLKLQGTPYEKIVNLTKDGDYDLIVISSHGKNALETFFYGSTTEKVVRNAQCSVLVVR